MAIMSAAHMVYLTLDDHLCKRWDPIHQIRVIKRMTIPSADPKKILIILNASRPIGKWNRYAGESIPS